MIFTTQMSRLNIEELPNEVLLEIFDYFDKAQLLHAIKVNKKWMELITNSSKLMKRMELLVCPLNIDTIMTQEIGIMHKKLLVHTHLLTNIQDSRIFASKFLKFSRHLKECVETVQIYLIAIPFYFALIMPMTNLTFLDIQAFGPLKSYEANKFQVSLPRLKKLRLKAATCFLRHLKEHILEEFILIDFHDVQTNQNINNFLKTCDKLRILKFHEFIPHLEDVESYKFKLSSFILSVSGEFLKGQHLHDSSSILGLIKLQKDTLKEMQLFGFSTQNFVAFVLNKIQLKSFKLDLKKITSDLGQIQANNSIKMLRIETTGKAMLQMLKIFRQCKAIEELQIVSNNHLMFSSWLRAAAIMPNLRSLYIDSLMEILLPQDLNLYNVETLTVTKLGSDAQLIAWIQLITRCPNLKKVVVMCWGQKFIQVYDETPKEVFLREYNFKFILFSLLNLEEIEIRGKFPMTNEFADLLVASTEYSKLRKFTFEAEMSIELMITLRKVHHTKMQVVVLKPPTIDRGVKRKIPFD